MLTDKRKIHTKNTNKQRRKHKIGRAKKKRQRVKESEQRHMEYGIWNVNIYHIYENGNKKK